MLEKKWGFPKTWAKMAEMASMTLVMTLLREISRWGRH